MNQKSLFATLALCALSGLWTATAQTQTIESMPPVVVKTVPESGAKEVAPGEMEIKVTYSKPMSDGSWSWTSAWQDSPPKMIGEPKYESDQKTCVVKVKLQPGKTYAFWLNSGNFKNFRDKQGHPAVPYLWIFKTKSQ